MVTVSTDDPRSNCTTSGGTWIEDDATVNVSSGSSSVDGGTVVFFEYETIVSPLTGGGAIGSAAGSKPSLLHKVACFAAIRALELARTTNHASGIGVGGTAGIGAGVMGVFGGLGIQIVADPSGNAGLALNGSFSFAGIGIGAQGGAQLSVSTAKSIYQLSGSAVDLSASAGPVGLDVSNNTLGGPTTATLTVGPGIGGKASGLIGASGTGILSSTNCSDVVH